MANSVNLNGSEYIQNIPGVYFDASASLVGKLGDEKAGSYITKIGLATGGVIDLTINLAKDPNNPGKVIASTVVANTTYYVAGAVADALVEAAIGAAIATLGISTAPVWLTVAGVGVAVAATTYLGGMAKDFLYNTTYNGIYDIENFDFYSPEIVGTVTKDEFIAQSASNDPDFCKNIFPQYVNYRQITEIKSGSESYLYNQLTKQATVNSTNEKDATEVILKNTQADKLTLNNKTYNISNLNNLELRNAIDGIDSISFLLSNITIYTREKIDLGSKGIHTVQSGETLSTIAQNLNDGTVTKDLVKLNPWLFDDGRIKFNYPDKVLIKEGTVISDDNNNTLTGDYDAQNILKDHNGGNDTLVGGSKKDMMDGGKGYDTYITGNGDTISDSDGSGEVLLGSEHLDDGEKKTIKHIEVTTTNFTKTYIYCECKTVTKWSEVETTELPDTEDDYYIDKATGTKYILNGSSLQVISSVGTITINNFSDGDLGIHLTSTEKIDKKEISKEVFLEEDFCSPLVIDLNSNRTINNGGELFGNFTQLADGSCNFAINSRNFKTYKEVA